MSRWEYSIEKPMSHDEYYFVPRYPRHVACAFIAVDYDHRDVSPEEELSIPYQKWIEEAIQSFAKHWGGSGRRGLSARASRGERTGSSRRHLCHRTS